jgi:hypothetical protein
MEEDDDDDEFFIQNRSLLEARNFYEIAHFLL